MLLFAGAGAAALALWPDLGPLMLAPLLPALLRAFTFRADSFEAAMPIRGRDVILARMLSMLAMVLLPLLVWIAAALAHGAHPWPLARMLEIVAIIALVVIAPFTVRPGDLQAPPLALQVTPWAILGSVAALSLWLLSPNVGLVLFTLAIPGTLLFVWLTTPASLVVAPAWERASSNARANAADAHAPPRAPRPYRALLRLVFPPQVLLFVLILLVAATSGSWLVMLGLAVLIGSALLRERTRWLQAFPLSNRARLLLIMVPGALTMAATVGITRAVVVWPSRSLRGINMAAPRTSKTGEYFDNYTQVSLEYWRRTPGGVPLVTAPWGESVPADTLSVLGMTLFNPYTTSSRQTPRFIEWQFERATTEVYGRPMTRASYDLWHPPTPPMPPSVVIINYSAVLVFVLAILCLGEIPFRRNTGAYLRHPIAAGFLPALPVFTVIVMDAYYGARRTTQIVVPLAEGAIRTLAGMLSPHPFLLAIVTAGPIVAAYMLLEWQFAHSETIGARAKPTA
ncbi:MAG: hypothetical protein ABJA80_04510 [bacterium]